MIKLGLKNYFKSLIYIFIPILCYGIGILISIAVECGVNQVDFITSFKRVFNVFVESSKSPINFSSMVAIILGISVLFGYFITRTIIRRKIAKRDLRTGIIMYVFDLIVVAASLWLIGYISTLWNIGALLTSLVTLLIYGAIALVEAYLAHYKKGLKLIDVVNMKNILLLYLVSIILYCITSGLCYLLKAFVNNFVYTFIQIPLYLISLAVIEFNAESYVIQYIKENKKDIEKNGSV